MATKELEKLTIAEIKKREKEANILLVASLIIFLAAFILLYIFKIDYIGATLPLLALTIIAFRVRRENIQILISRIEKLEKD